MESIADVFNLIRKKLFWCVYVPIFGNLFRLLPLKQNKVFFDNFSGKGYADNPKYIAEEIARRTDNIKLIWLSDSFLNLKYPKYINVVRLESIRELYERATSKVWVDNIRNVHPVKKRKGQIYLQTWHGSFSPKKVEKDAEDQLSKHYCQEAKYDGSITDGILVNSELLEKQYRRAFWLSEGTEYLRYGLPRYDVLLKKGLDQNEIIKLKRKYGVDQNSYIVLYAPTFRDDESIDGYKIDFNRVVAAFEKRLGKSVQLIIRLHPSATDFAKTINYSENIINGSIVPDLQELSMISDSVITDYSTSLYDFILLKKPIFICALDLQHYQELRGLLPEYFDMPFRITQNNDDLIKAIEEFEQDKYFERVNQYFLEHPMYDDGDASKKVVDWIIKKMEIQ